MSGDQIAIVGVSRRSGEATVEKLRMLNLDRVKSAEFVADAPDRS